LATDAVDYRVELADVHAHRFRVTLRLARPAARQRFTLPVWVPGSYLVRDFSRHLSGLGARQGSREVPLVQQDKTSWVAHCEGGAALVLRYEVYAFDPSVRGAFLDAERGFFNGSSLFLCADGRASQPHRLQIGRLPADWALSTAMPSPGPRRFEAASYDELIDHPVTLGRFWRGAFQAGGRPHELVVSGAWPSFDGPRLLADVQRICETQIRFWHGPRGRPPFDRYVFMLHVADDGYGGLEHRASTALTAARRDLPRLGIAEAGDADVGLLGLFSHEYFHAWNVKRLKPREFVAPDLAREAPSGLLWFFEGFTSYYDDLLLLRAGLIDRSRYLRLLARPLNAVLATPGRRVQSVADASFDAWTKHYRPDENTPNATVSYYQKGALVALLCDLTLRQRGAGTLDDVMRRLWKTSAGGPIGEGDIADALVAVGGEALRLQLHAWVHGTGELPVPALLATAGVSVRDELPSLAALLGLKLSEGAFSGVQVKQVLRGSAAEAAGLAPGDELLAVDGWRLRRLDDARQWLGAARSFDLLLARDQRVVHCPVTLPAAPAAPGVVLLADERADAAALALRRAWLGG
jgi:predicted metalloprotease with PDZ domain